MDVDFQDLWIETPDFSAFANGLQKVKNREELIATLKKLAMERGFRLLLPYG
jgi:hypothetical protein